MFSEIYKNRKWGKNVPLSGEGSSPAAVDPYLKFLHIFLAKHKEVKTILDIGHGDWEMWPEGFFEKYRYFGVDVVSSLSNEMNITHGNEMTTFIAGDFLEMALPSSDILLIKDVLIHLSNVDITRALEIFSKYRFVIVTTDVQSSGFRVYLACLIKLMRKRELKTLFNYGFRAKKSVKHELGSDIKTGGYHWVDLNSAFWQNKHHNFHFIEMYNYEVSGITLGRKVTKQIVIFGT